MSHPLEPKSTINEKQYTDQISSNSAETTPKKHLVSSEHSQGRLALSGWLIILLFFGGFGVWAATAPLNGAVVANGFVKVEGNRKSVQHLDGGLVRELRVSEGDEVKAGDVLIVLDDTQARAEFTILSQQYLVLRLTEQRLKSEFYQKDEVMLPTDLKQRASDPDVAEVFRGQVQLFESRKSALLGERKLIDSRIDQLESQIDGAEAQINSYKEQLGSIIDEIKSIESLVKSGLIAKPRYLQLTRSRAGLQGQIAETTARVERAQEAIAEQQQQIKQLDSNRAAEITKELYETEAKLLEVIPRLSNASAILKRVELRAPYTGRVVGLNVFAVGAVIGRGEKILDIVPIEESLIIETEVAVEDISEVHADMGADIHLTAYKQRITPVVHGKVLQVSADRLVDDRSGLPYFTALVAINERDLENIPNIKLYPGMPATVIIPTVERTALDYFISPLTMAFHKSFRQK